MDGLAGDPALEDSGGAPFKVGGVAGASTESVGERAPAPVEGEAMVTDVRTDCARARALTTAAARPDERTDQMRWPRRFRSWGCPA